MTNSEILSVAMKQSAADSNCSPEDFLSEQNKIVISRKNAKARRYLDLPFDCDLTSYGNNIVASVSENLTEIVKEYIEKYNIYHCFETPNLHFFIDKLKPFGLNICFMASYYLPDIEALKLLECPYETRVLYSEDFKKINSQDFGNALGNNPKYPDELGIGAFNNGKLIGLAACSSDCDTMWQIGVDVLPEYRRKGVASSLTSRLALEILLHGIVPFYCCAWSNIRSARNALKSGFRPAWVQITAKSEDFIAKMNR